MPWKERVARRLLPNLFLNAFGMDDARMAGFADRLDAFRPELVQGYATALDIFASFLLATGREVAAPRVVRSSAEALTAEARARIERAFRAPVRDVYGSRESTHLAAQCVHGGFHVLGAGRVVEVVDDAGAPAGPGVPGRVLVTDLSNRAMALVRYENGDVARWIENANACARVRVRDALQDWPRLILSRALQGIEYDSGPHSMTRVQLRVRLLKDARGADEKKRTQAIEILKFMKEKGVLMALKGESGPHAPLAAKAFFEVMNPKIVSESLPDARTPHGAHVVPPK